MARLSNISNVVIILTSLAMICLGCNKNERNESNDYVELTFSTSIDSPTRSDARDPGIENDTQLQVLLYKAGTYGTASEQLISQAIYKADLKMGDIYLFPLNEGLWVKEGLYDLRFYTPHNASLVGNALHFSSRDNFLNAVLINQSITKESPIVEVSFKRLCARIDVVVKPKSNAFLNTMTMTTGGTCVIEGLPTTGSVNATDEYAIASDQRTSTASLLNWAFKTSGTGLNTVISSVTDKRGVAVIPVTDFAGSTLDPIKPIVTIPLTIDGVAYTARLDLSASGFHIKAGHRYIIEMTVKKDAQPEYVINVEPWIEGGNQDLDTGAKPTLGEYFKRAGIVFWLNSATAGNYKSMYIYQPTTKLAFADAESYATLLATGWRLPTASELKEIYALKSTITTSLVSVGGTAIAAANYISSESDGTDVQVVNLSTGVQSAAPVATLLNVIAVKEFN